MPELRQDRFTKEWVFVASEDVKHPQELIVQRARKPMPSFDPHCPFCPGHENHTAPEILRVPSPKGGWALRVIPRKFTGMISELPERGSPAAVEGFGIPELIVEAPDHSLTTALLPETQLLSLLRSAKSRYDEICLDPRISYATIYKKQAVDGSRLEHSQSQDCQPGYSARGRKPAAASASSLWQNGKLHLLFGAVGRACRPQQNRRHFSALHRS